MKKMNNKGFSLVELIVVVLIMAIIAVALAPQVMRWVENSRKSNDIENYNALVEAANVAGASETVLQNLSGAATITMTTAGVTISNTQLAANMHKTLPDVSENTDQSTKIKVTGDWSTVDWTSAPGAGYTDSQFQITVEKTNDGVKVTKVSGKFPAKVFE